MRDSARNIERINSARNEEPPVQDLPAREAEEEPPVPIQQKDQQAVETDQRPEAECQEEPDQAPEPDLPPETDPVQEVQPQDHLRYRDGQIPRDPVRVQKAAKHTERTGSAEMWGWY